MAPPGARRAAAGARWSRLVVAMARPQALVATVAQRHVDHAHHRRVALDVLDRRRPEPADRGAGGGAAFRRRPARRHPARSSSCSRAPRRSWCPRRPTATACNDAIDGLTTSIGTAIGNGVLTSIDALSRVNPEIAPSTVRLTPAERDRDRFASQVRPRRRGPAHRRRGDDRRRPARRGPKQAADRRVRVFTIGFGTSTPSPLVCSPEQLGGELTQAPDGGVPPPTFDPGRRGNFLEIDEATLRAVAKTTGGLVPPRRQRRSAPTGVRQPAASDRHREGGARAHGVPRGPGRIAGRRCGGDLAVVEPGGLRPALPRRPRVV